MYYSHYYYYYIRTATTVGIGSSLWTQRDCRIFVKCVCFCCLLFVSCLIFLIASVFYRTNGCGMSQNNKRRQAKGCQHDHCCRSGKAAIMLLFIMRLLNAQYFCFSFSSHSHLPNKYNLINVYILRFSPPPPRHRPPVW
jgi:hypothetical protein